MKSPPQQVPDLVEQGFMDARHKLLDIAAFLDRLERHGQEDDFRIAALYEAFNCLSQRESQRTYAVQMLLSDPSVEPIPAAHTKGATGAHSAQGQA